MQEKYQDIDKMEELYHLTLNYSLDRFDKYHSSNEGVQRKVNLLSWIAFALIFTAILNYILIVVATYVRRAKEMAVYKSYGAGRNRISQMIYVEVLVHIVAALAIGALLILLFRHTVEELLGVPVPALLSTQSSFILLMIVSSIFLVTGILPARLFSSIPVASAFRNYKQSKSNWMLALPGLPHSDKEQLHIGDLYGIDENYLSLMEIPIIEGKGFERGVSTEKDMIISRSLAQRISDIAGWSDGVVGKDLIISEHGLCRVVGVYEDVRTGFIGAEVRPLTVMFYSPTPQSNIFIRFYHLNGEGLQKPTNVLQSVMPTKDIVVTPYKESMLKGYDALRLFRNSVMAGSIIAIILTLIGLLAYLRSEINRRSAEIAIRKVNGATITNVLTLFGKNVLYLSIPALLVGSVITLFIARRVLVGYSEKIDLGLLLFILCSITVLTITLSILTAGCWRVATQNPVKSLKTE